MVSIAPLSPTTAETASFEPVARLVGVSKHFGGAPALQDVSIDVARGRVLGIIGRSGAGKSTLIRLLNGLERPDSGSVQFEGQELTRLDESALKPVRQRIGMIFQQFNLLSASTVSDNIGLALRIARWPKRDRARRIEELLALVGLSDKARAYPAQLSGGQKQRVGIARALAAEPALLLSDEATSALDPETTQSILALLRDINRRLGLSIVLITHEMSVIREVADDVAVIEAGRLVEYGTVADVLTRPQSAVTQRLVHSLRPRLPSDLQARLADQPAHGSSPILRLDVLGPQARAPLLHRLAAAVGAEVALLHGGIDQIQGEPIGRLFISLTGDGADLGDRAVAVLSEGGIDVEVIGHVRRPV